MDERAEITLRPVSHITADAIGPPGKRVFYLQGLKGSHIVTLLIEKFQLQQLAIGIEQFMAQIYQRLPDLPPASSDYDEERMHILPPVEPLFRVSEFGLAYDADDDLLGLIARENPAPQEDAEQIEMEPETPGGVVGFWASRDQMRALVNWGLEVTQRGRPQCEQCGQPKDPEGHFCARKNGHKR